MHRNLAKTDAESSYAGKRRQGHSDFFEMGYNLYLGLFSILSVDKRLGNHHLWFLFMGR